MSRRKYQEREASEYPLEEWNEERCKHKVRKNLFHEMHEALKHKRKR